jgi:hypothetical protein
MSDQTITHLNISLKELNARLHNLNRIMDRLLILAYQQKRLARHYGELSLQCKNLSRNMNELDVIIFEAHQEARMLEGVKLS